MRWAYLSAAIVLEVTATLSLRAAVDAPGWFVVVVVGYLGSFAALTMTLRAGMPIAVAYGIWSAIGVAVTAALGSTLFGDVLSLLVLVGIVLVVGGVLLVEFGSHPPKRPADAAAASTPDAGAPDRADP